MLLDVLATKALEVLMFFVAFDAPLLEKPLGGLLDDELEPIPLDVSLILGLSPLLNDPIMLEKEDAPVVAEAAKADVEAAGAAPPDNESVDRLKPGARSVPKLVFVLNPANANPAPPPLLPVAPPPVPTPNDGLPLLPVDEKGEGCCLAPPPKLETPKLENGRPPAGAEAGAGVAVEDDVSVA